MSTEPLKTIGRGAPTSAVPSGNGGEPIAHLKPAVAPERLAYKQLLDGPFWQAIPAYREIDEKTFLDHSWQAKHSITNPPKLLAAVQDLVPASFIEDVAEGFRRAPMSLRVSPYLLSLIDWAHPYEDPL